jgi:PAS domain S-box-containing protein
MVLEADVKVLISNPLLGSMLLVILVAVFAFVLGKVLVRRMGQSIADEAILTDEGSSREQIPLHIYHGVIQHLKQQKYELQSLQQVERRRAKASDNISAAILSNLSSGVLFFTVSGLVRQTNAAAKQILGFASPVGMTAAELFRAAHGSEVVQAIDAALHDKLPRQCTGVRYITPAGVNRTLDITVTVVRAAAGEILGAACLVNDCTEMARIRRQLDLRAELSGEMAFELRNSLATISGYAQQLAASGDQNMARQLASDIAAESAHLDHTIGGFLTGGENAQAAVGS